MTSSGGFIRTVLGDVTEPAGSVFAHEHLIIDSPLIAEKFPHIHLHDVGAAVSEVEACATAGVGLMLDAMPVASGRDPLRLAEISQRTGVGIISTTGLHHDRYYGPLHWSNRVGVDELVTLFVADLQEGIDEFDYTSPLVRRGTARAGVVKVATSGQDLDARDRRNLQAVAEASVLTGAPVLTHCEDGLGGLEQVENLIDYGVPAGSIILSHVDKSHNLTYLHDLADTGAMLELDQTLRQIGEGTSSISVRAVLSLVASGFDSQIVIGTDGARRSLWSTLGGTPGLAWLATGFPPLLEEVGIPNKTIAAITRDNAVRALTWRATSDAAADGRHQ